MKSRFSAIKAFFRDTLMVTQARKSSAEGAKPKGRPQRAEQHKAATKQSQGQLVIIGGAEDKSEDSTIFREFVRRAGATEARILLVTTAAKYPRDVESDYIRIFERLGVKEVRAADSIEQVDKDTLSVLEALKEATGVFFPEGELSRISELLNHQQLRKVLQQRYNQGLVVAGTGVGASIMSEFILSLEDSQTTGELQKGMSLLSEAIVDSYFAQSGRINRLLAAVAQHPHLIGLGININTAIVIKEGQLEVVGEGTCTVVDLAEVSDNCLKIPSKNQQLAIGNVKLHVLPDGYGYDLKKRQPIISTSVLG